MATLTSILAALNARQQAGVGASQGAADTLRHILAKNKDTTAKDAGAGTADTKPSSRTVKDTVTLSDSGQKIVNLARGLELAEEFRSKPVDKGFFAGLAKAREDVFRIGQLFAGTIKALFQQSRNR
jgi:hypothetical protein